MAAVWTVFGIVSAILFEDVPRGLPTASPEPEPGIPLQPLSISHSKEDVTVTRRSIEEGRDLPELDNIEDTLPDTQWRPSARQWGVIVTMCWFSMTCCKSRSLFADARLHTHA